MQEADGHLLPCAYFSRSLTDSERNCSARDLEAHGVLLAVEKWRHHLWGCPAEVRVLTDHQSLEFLRSQRDLTGRVARWAVRLSEYNLKVMYYPGRHNVVADALSRLPHSSAIPAVLEHLAQRDPDINDVELPIPPAMVSVLSEAQWSAVLTREVAMHISGTNRHPLHTQPDQRRGRHHTECTTSSARHGSTA